MPNLALADVAAPGPLYDRGLPPPQASLACGAAGVATFLLRRLAQIHADAALLAQADAWARRAGEGDTTAGADDRSPWHGAAGVHAVQAQVARALGDGARQAQAVQAFVQASRPLSPSHDATTGLPATLLAAALLLADLDATDAAQAHALRALQQLADEALAMLAAQIGSRGTLAALPALRQLGMAHGWAGLLHAALRASQALRRGVPGWVPPLLDALAAQARPMGRGVAWPTWRPGAVPAPDESDFAPGWCRGSAGQVHLWLCAHAMTGQPRWLDLAVKAGQHAARHPGLCADLCCGLAGRGYALLALYRHTGDSRWLHDARTLADRAATVHDQAFQRPVSLLRGRLGVALLCADLQRPEQAAMPFFAAEAAPG